MAINRYVDVNFDQPVSNYVPLPLEMLYKLGKDASKDYEDTISGVTTAKGLLSKHKTQTSVKVYDASAPGGVRDAQIDFEPQRQAYQSKLQTEMESITNDYIKDKDTAKFKQRMNSLKGQAVAMDNDLATKSALVEKIEKHNEEIAKNQDFPNQGYLGNPMLSYNTDFYNTYSKDQSKISNYASYNIAKKINRAEEIGKYFKELGSEVNEDVSKAYATDTGYIKSKYREGVTEDKIKNHFNSWLESSPVKEDILMEAKDHFSRTGLDPNESVDVTDPITGEKIKDSKGKVIQTTRWDNFIDNEVEAALGTALGYKKSKGRDALTTDATWRWEQDKKVSEEETRLKFQLGLQQTPASGSPDDNSFTTVAQSLLGNNMFDVRDGKLHYNPLNNGEKYVEVMGKKVKFTDLTNAEDAEFKKLFPNAVITSTTPDYVDVRFKDKTGKVTMIKYPVKESKSSSDDAVKARKQVMDVANRLGYIGDKMDEAMKTVDGYLAEMHGVQSKSTQFPPGFEKLLNQEFAVKTDDEGKIINPGQLPYMEIKNADGVLQQDPAANATLLKNARFVGFTKTLHNKNIKPGDIEMVSGDGNRFIVSTGKDNLMNSAAQSHNLLASYNDFIVSGKKNINMYGDSEASKKLEAALAGGMKLNKNALHVTDQETDSQGTSYTSYIIQEPDPKNPGKVKPGFKVFVKTADGRTDVISAIEAARRLDSDGLRKHAGFYDPSTTQRQIKDYYDAPDGQVYEDDGNP